MSDSEFTYAGENEKVMYFDVVHKHTYMGTVEVKKARIIDLRDD